MTNLSILPDNILIFNDDRSLLLGFGAGGRVIHGKTQVRIAFSKSPYAPIRQCDEIEMQSSEKGPWKDIYNLLVVICFAMTGMKPESSVLRAYAISSRRFDNLKPLSGLDFLRGRYNRTLLRAINKALSLKLGDRPYILDNFMNFYTQRERGVWKKKIS